VKAWAAALLLGACMPTPDAPPRADPARGELAARPASAPSAPAEPGLSEAQGGAFLYVPPDYDRARPAPLIVMLHGAGGTARHSIDLARPHADRTGAILFAPKSRRQSWDVISARRYGPDVSALDGSLQRIFSRYAVDPERVAIAGFSDGASYALSLGLANGDLFRHILAFSSGFAAHARQQGTPAVFISHGVDDRVLPIQVCSRRIVPQLERAGLAVTYREFPDGHIVPPELAREAFNRLAAR